jgi:hypothetical protein
MALVIVGASTPELMETALQAFEIAGFQRARAIEALDDGDGALGIAGGGAEKLAAADHEGIRYVLVHVGQPDGQVGGTFERAHHRVEASQLADLAPRLRTRERMLVRCLAFGFKNGVPQGAGWVVDVRFLANPYWVEELRPLDGNDQRIRDYVLSQPAAIELLDRMESMLRWLIPLEHRSELTIAFGCTGGRHRSVVIASEMARRLANIEEIDIS